MEMIRRNFLRKTNISSTDVLPRSRLKSAWLKLNDTFLLVTNEWIHTILWIRHK